MYWGVGCEVAGSAAHAWSLHLPAPLRAAQVPAGDVPPIDLPEAAIVLDFDAGPGGALSAVRVATGSPGGPGFTGLDGYWDVRGEMPPGTLDAAVTLTFDPAILGGVDPDDLRLATLVEDAWRPVPTTVDVAAGTATARVDAIGPMVLATGFSVPVERTSWSSLKVVFR